MHWTIAMNDLIDRRVEPYGPLRPLRPPRATFPPVPRPPQATPSARSLQASPGPSSPSRLMAPPGPPKPQGPRLQAPGPDRLQAAPDPKPAGPTGGQMVGRGVWVVAVPGQGT